MKAELKAETSEAIEKFLREYKPLAGFEKRVEDYFWATGKAPQRKMILENKAEKIRFELVVTKHDNKDKYHTEEYGAGFSYSGHTYFEIEGRGQVTFDRTGVEDSFYGGPKQSLNVLLVGQLEKIVASRKRAQGTSRLPYPLNNFYRTPEEIETLKKTLKTKGVIQFFPSGFGTGYTVSTRRTPWAKTATALTRFFDVGQPLYFMEMDCD